MFQKHREKIKQTNYVTNALKQREKRVEKRINFVRLGLLIFFAIGDNIGLFLFYEFSAIKFFKLNIVTVSYLGVVYFIHHFLNKEKYHVWIKYFSVTFDFSVIVLVDFYLLKDTFNSMGIFKDSTFAYSFMIFFLLINLISALRYGKSIIIYSTVVCTGAFIIMYSKLFKYASDLTFYFIIGFYLIFAVFLSGVISYWISKTLIKKVTINFELEEKEKLIKEDLKLAQMIQNSLISKKYNDFDNINIQVVFQPMIEVGGDIYDIFKFKDGNFRIFLADATGHGIQAALTTMLIKAEYEKIKLHKIPPDRVITIFNDTFTSNYYNLNVFLTCMVLDIDFKKGEIEYCSAGHPEQYFIKNNGEIIKLVSTGKMLGLMQGMKYEKKQIDFIRNDKIVLFSDGAFEEFSSDNKEFGEERFYSLLEKNKHLPIEEINEEIMNAVNSWCGENFNDDITIISLEFF